MSDFPLEPLDVHVEAWIDGAWEDLGSFADPTPLGATNRLVANPIEITHGRQDEGSRVSPGEFRVRLWNDDGLLTPIAASDWWRDDGTGWDLNTQMRVRVGSNVRLHGEVSEILPVWPVGDIADGDEAGVSFVDVTVSGILRRLGQRSKPLRSSLYRRVTSTTNLPHILDYFPMEEGSDATAFATGIPGGARQSMSFTGDVKPGTYSLIAGSEPIATVDAGRTGHWYAPVQGFTDQGVVEVFLANPEKPNTTTSLFRPIDVYSTGTLARWSVEVRLDNDLPVIQLRAFDPDGVQVHTSVATLVGSEIFFTDAPMQMRLELDQDGGNVDWIIDCWTVTRDTDPGTRIQGTYSGTLGTVIGIGGGVGDAPPGGVAIGHVILHTNRAAGWLVYADIGRWGEEARQRIGRLCDEEAVPRSLEVGIDIRSMSCGPQRALTLPALLDEAADADRGILGERHDLPYLRYVHRRFRYNQSPRMTLDAAQSQIANPFSPVRDDQQIRNDVTAQRLNGASARLMDESSIERFGIYDEQLTLNVASDLIVRHIAGWQLRLGADDGIRFPQLSLDLAIAYSKRSQWGQIRVGDEVRVQNPPPQLAVGDIDLIVQGWNELLATYAWNVTMNCSPADSWKVAKWGVSLWDDGSVLGL